MTHSILCRYSVLGNSLFIFFPTEWMVDWILNENIYFLTRDSNSVSYCHQDEVFKTTTEPCSYQNPLKKIWFIWISEIKKDILDTLQQNLVSVNYSRIRASIFSLLLDVSYSFLCWIVSNNNVIVWYYDLSETNSCFDTLMELWNCHYRLHSRCIYFQFLFTIPSE